MRPFREAPLSRPSATALETALSCAVCVSALPQYTGALGAAILVGRQSRTRDML